MYIDRRDYQSKQPSQQANSLMLHFDVRLNSWVLRSRYAKMFTQHLTIIQKLRKTVKKDWIAKQTANYVQFLDHLSAYIKDYVFKGLVHYHEDFLMFVQQIKKFNPDGVDLYQQQLEQLSSKIEEQDSQIFQQAALKEEIQQQTLEDRAPKVEEKNTRQKIFVEEGPDIDIERLYKGEWDKDKYMDVKELHKQNVSIALIGQINSGKSSLTGRILSQLQQKDLQPESHSQKDKARFLTDFSNFLPEERQDGRTREYAKFSFALEKRRLTMFDTPGHKDFACNLIQAVHQAEVAALLISAKEGEFESDFEKDDQIKKQAMTVKAAGIRQLIVVITKMGTVSWSEKRFLFIKEKISSYLQKKCGFEGVAYLPIDSVEDINIHQRIADFWYKGPCFLECLEDVSVAKRDPSGPLRVTVNDKAKINGAIYLFCVVQSGTIIEDHSVTIHPERQQLVIKEIYNVNDERLPFATAGENVKIKVKGVDMDEISRGSIICNNVNNCNESAEFTAIITLIDLPEQKKLLSSGYGCLLHVHALEVQVEIAQVLTRKEKGADDALQSTFLFAGEEGTCNLRIQKPVCFQLFAVMPRLGSFFLLDEGKIIGFGEITAIKPSQKVSKEREEKLMRQKTVLERKEQEAAKKEWIRQENAKKEAENIQAARLLAAERAKKAFQAAVTKVSQTRRYFQQLSLHQEYRKAHQRREKEEKEIAEKRNAAREQALKRQATKFEATKRQKVAKIETEAQNKAGKKQVKKRYVQKSTLL